MAKSRWSDSHLVRHVRSWLSVRIDAWPPARSGAVRFNPHPPATRYWCDLEFAKIWMGQNGSNQTICEGFSRASKYEAWSSY